ncbi:hypothetical protein PC110_g2522 [Phytophthora cactorum]|uniref:WRKY19-like zinc finger domain-containing protein n=1 Tax=Phytophthora cactorum TaxID=29920 RepID=A0A329SX85_9STRA|nr:hypothetical protein PC110_g2522 [Phytophthora cactorum]
MTTKAQLDFILNPVVEAARLAPVLPSATSLLPMTTCFSPSWSAGSPSSVSGWNGEQAVLAALLRAPSTPVLRHKRNFEQLPGLTEKGCTSLAVSRRSCVRHGGGSRCTFEGCTNGAKLRNRCFQHGGSTICLAAGCNSKAKRYGYCWSHGGGRICSHEGCVKVAAQGGSCWAHGGGNRCKLEGCSKRSYQKYGYYCKSHSAYNM